MATLRTEWHEKARFFLITSPVGKVSVFFRTLTANLNTLWKEEMIIMAIFSLDDEMTLFNS